MSKQRKKKKSQKDLEAAGECIKESVIEEKEHEMSNDMHHIGESVRTQNTS